MNTPAVTIVAAWIRAETGVGPSIASGSQVCSRNWADLPMAPRNSSRQMLSSTGSAWPNTTQAASGVSAWNWAAVANTLAKSTVPKVKKMAAMPSAKPKSPTRLTMKAFIAAALALSFLNQKPISR